jgi:hypothetical protein
MKLKICEWMKDELDRRKDLYCRLWLGKPVERIPLDIRIIAASRHTVREQFQDGEKQLEAALESALATWKLIPSSDAIPAMRPDVGCSCLSSAFGAEYYWGNSFDQTPGIHYKIISDLEKQVDLLPTPDPLTDGWLPEGLK